MINHNALYADSTDSYLALMREHFQDTPIYVHMPLVLDVQSKLLDIRTVVHLDQCVGGIQHRSAHQRRAGMVPILA